MSHSRKPGYAVLGLGVGMAHAEAAFASDNADLIAICDINEKRLADAAEAFPGAKPYSDFEDMLADPSVDIVSICLPSGMHAEYAVRAMRAGKHVLVEKPIDISLEAAETIEAARLETGLRCGVCMQNRNNVSSRPIKAAIDSGRLGKLLFGTFAVKWLRPDNYFSSTPWRGTWAMDGGGSLINQSIHTVDLMQWFMGDVESVTSNMALFNHDIETEDFTASLIKFKSGAHATFLSTTCAYPGLSTEICVYGTNGSVEADADRIITWKMKDSENEEAEEREMLKKCGQGNSQAEWKDVGHTSMVEDMIAAVVEGRDPMIMPREAMKSLRIVRAIYDSAKTGKPIIFD